ncbi:MAG: four helix bundle protein [Bacteroidota bacterium]|nr:four helix bundle protein [Bacteroidota bacterium]
MAEGAARNTLKDFNNFLAISLCSISKLATQMMISFNLGFLNKPQFEELFEQLVAIRK